MEYILGIPSSKRYTKTVRVCESKQTAESASKLERKWCILHYCPKGLLCGRDIKNHVRACVCVHLSWTPKTELSSANREFWVPKVHFEPVFDQVFENLGSWWSESNSCSLTFVTYFGEFQALSLDFSLRATLPCGSNLVHDNSNTANNGKRSLGIHAFGAPVSFNFSCLLNTFVVISQIRKK